MSIWRYLVKNIPIFDFLLIAQPYFDQTLEMVYLGCNSAQLAFKLVMETQINVAHGLTQCSQNANRKALRDTTRPGHFLFDPLPSYKEDNKIPH